MKEKESSHLVAVCVCVCVCVCILIASQELTAIHITLTGIASAFSFLSFAQEVNCNTIKLLFKDKGVSDSEDSDRGGNSDSERV